MLGFFFLAIIIIFVLIIILLLSTLEIDIKKFKISNNKEIKIEQEYLINISIKFLNKIKIINIKLDNNKMQKAYIKIKNKNIKFKQIKDNISLNINKQALKKILKHIPQISNIKFTLNIGLEDIIATSFLIATISTFFSIFIRGITNKNSKIDYKINPLYINKNIYELNLNCIIYTKIVHIIYIIYIIGKGRKKNERTSNRRSYEYRYE